MIEQPAFISEVTAVLGPFSAPVLIANQPGDEGLPAGPGCRFRQDLKPSAAALRVALRSFAVGGNGGCALFARSDMAFVQQRIEKPDE